jgi:predicted secreted protein
MAVTAGIINGTDLLVYSGANVIAHSTTCSMSVSQDMRDASTKASAGWKAVLPGQRSWQIETQGLIAFDANYNLAYLLSLITAKTRVHLYWRTANTDNFYYHGFAYLTSISAEAPNQGNATYSASFIGDGILTYVAISSAIIWDPPPDGLLTGYYYDLLASDDVACILPDINDVLSPIIVKNSSTAGTIEISATNALLIDGVATIYLATGEFTTITPMVTYFDALGTHTTSVP